MAPKKPRDREQIGRTGEAGLFLVYDRTPAREWESYPRDSRKLARERLGPVSWTFAFRT
jgi:hypothetical protein